MEGIARSKGQGARSEGRGGILKIFQKIGNIFLGKDTIE